MSDQKKTTISEKERKQIYRAKLREQLGDEEYKKQQALKKKEYRAKVNASKNPQQQQQQVVKQVVQQVVEQVVIEVPQVEQVEQTVKEVPQVNINIPLADPFKPIAQVDNNNQLVNVSINNVIQLPPELYPFEYGRTGGLYVHSTKPLKEGDKPEKPKLLTPYEVYPLKRIDSTADGECLLIRVITPHDPVNEFLFPIKYAYAQDKFKEIMSSKRVLFDPNGVLLFMNYFIK